MITPKSENLRMAYFYNLIKRERDRIAYEIVWENRYEIVLGQSWPFKAENNKDDFDQIWNLDDEIFYQIDIESNEDIKTQIHRLQNTVTETTQDE